MKIRPNKTSLRNQQNQLIGQETLVRISRKADNTNADFPEFNLLSCETLFALCR